MKEKGRKILIILLLAVAIGCAGYLIWYYASAAKSAESYEKARKEAVVDTTNQTTDEEEKGVIPIDCAALQETNPDVHAWIKIDGTNIDYPVVQNEEQEEYYLTHTWEGKYAAEGAIFTQAFNKKDFTDFNTVIYGHQMGEGVETMFHQLGNYLDDEYMKDHSEIVIYTPEHILTYKVFAAVVYDDRHLMKYYDYDKAEDRQAFLDSLKNSRDMRNKYNDQLEVTTSDRIISLSTCIAAEPDHRLLVEAVLTDEK